MRRIVLAPQARPTAGRWVGVGERRSSSIGPRIRRAFVGGTAALLIVGGVGAVWLVNQPQTARACTVALTIDDVGGATPAEARERLLELGRHEFDITKPDEVTGSGDEVTAIYVVDRPDLDPTHRYYQKAVTERREDGRWYVIDMNQCESWTQ